MGIVEALKGRSEFGMRNSVRNRPSAAAALWCDKAGMFFDMEKREPLRGVSDSGP